MKNKSIRQRVFAALLAASIVFTMMPATPFAAEAKGNPIEEELQTETSKEEVDTVPEMQEMTSDVEVTTEKEQEEIAQGETQTENEQDIENEVNEDSEAIEALQSHIDALPTVDEFIALADGTTVEDSTLNQAQLDVYNEAQAIAEEMDKLTDEEQGQLDTGKLEALFEYFNSMTDETATTISPVTSSSYYISSGGTYTLKGGTYSTSASAVVIDTTAAVTLNIEGDITATSSSKAFIYVQSACSNLTINGNGHTVKQTGDSNVFYVASNATAHFNNCNFTSNTETTIFQDAGTLYIESGYYKRTGTTGQVVSMPGGTLYIKGGTIENAGPTGTSDTVAVGGKVYMTGGTIISPKSAAIRSKVSGASMSVTGGTIKNSLYGVYVHSNNPACTIGNVTFSGNTNDVYLGSGQKFTLSTDYAGADNIKVGVADTVGDSVKRQITTAGTAQSMLAKVSSVNSSYSVNYDTSGKYLYLWKHSHSWNYSASGNTVTAKCNTSSCGYSSGLTLTLTAPDMTYTGSAYDKASVTNNITSVTGTSADSIRYYNSKDQEMSTPVIAGTYTAKVKIGGATATANFEITKASVTKPSADGTTFVYNGNSQTYNIASSSAYNVTGNTRTDAGTQTVTVALKNKNYEWSDGSTDDLTFTFTIAKADITPAVSLADWVYGNTASTPKVTGNSGNGTITYSYKEQDADDSTYTEVTDFSTIPVGSYTLKASIAESTNYNANEATCNFAVTKQPITVEVSMDGWTYGDKANTPNITDGSNPGSGDVTYTYYTDAACTSKTTSADGATSDGAAPKNAGTYYVKAEVSETDNHAAGSGTKEFTIAKKVIEIEWSGDSFTYNGKPQEPTAKATGLVDGDTCTITVTGGQKDTNAKVGNTKYTATATTVDNTNYTLPTTGTTHDFTITPAELTVTWTDTELTYNGSEQAPKAELSGVLEGDTCDVTVAGGKTDTNVKSQQGTYTAEAECSDKNYVVNEQGKTTEFTIAPKAIGEAEIELSPGDQLHNGNEITQTISRVTVDGKELTEGSDYKIDDSSTLTATDFGTYIVTVTGTGNYTGSFSKEWRIKDENPPTGQISIAKNQWTSFWNGVTFGHFFKETQKVTINASDEGSGVDKVYYYNSNVILSLDEVKALADGEWKAIKNGSSYNIDPENQYVVYAKITDKSGNVTYISSEGFVIDKTAPKITGVKDQGAYCEAVTFTATDTYLKTVTVDGKEVTLDADGSYQIAADNKAHTIIAEDKAGNTTTVQITVYDGHSWKAPVFTWSADYSSATATITCAHDASHTQTENCTVKKEITKQATGTEKGEITYTATVTINGKTYEDTKTQETAIAGSEEIGSNGGKITTEIIVADDMPKTEIKNLTVETAKALLTADELAQVNAGEEITIYLEANSLTEDAVSTGDKTYVEGKLDGIMEQLMQSEGLTSKKQVTTGIQYIDLSLYKKIGNGTATKLKSTGQKELEITVDIPDNLKSDNSKRTYYIIRVHETDAGAEVDILPAAKSGDTLTFTTDRFSTYAIAFAEPNEYVVAAKVTLNQTQAALTSKGSTTQLTATVEPSNATNKNVTWSSSDTSVATVDANGVVTAVGNGTAIITVTTEDGGFTATATITVNISSNGGNGSGSNGNNGNNNNGSTTNNTGNSNNTDNASTIVPDIQIEAQSATAPKTGDSARTTIGIMLLVLAGAVFAQLFRKKKKQ